MKKLTALLAATLLIISGYAKSFTIEDTATTQDTPDSKCNPPSAQSLFEEDTDTIFAWIDFKNHLAGNTYHYVWRNSLDANIKTRSYPARTYDSNGCSFTPFDISLIEKNEDNMLYVDFYYNNNTVPEETMAIEIDFDGPFDISKTDIPDFDQSILDDKISYPDYYLTAYYCGPSAASNWLKYFDEQGYNFVDDSLSSSNSVRQQFSIIKTLGEDKYMKTQSSKESGTGFSSFIRGIDQYVTSHGHKIKKLEYYGWRLVNNQTYRRANIIPDPNIIREKFGENTAIWLSLGWYEKDSSSNTYERKSGHYVTVAGFGHNGTESDSDYLILHDSSKRSKTTTNEYVQFTQLPADAEMIKGCGNICNEFTHHGSSISFGDLYQITGDIAINTGSGANTAIIDGIYILQLEETDEAPETDVSITISDVTETDDKQGSLQKFRIDVKNSGPDTAVDTEINLDVSLGSELTVMFAEDENRVQCKTQNSKAVCNIYRIDNDTDYAPNKTISLHAYVVPSQAGTLTIDVSASSYNFDPDTNNNQTSLSKTINGTPFCQEFSDTVSNHEVNNRVYSETAAGWWWFPGTTTYYITGSQENLGTNANLQVTLKEQPQGYFSKGNCNQENAPTLSINSTSVIAKGIDISGTANDSENNIDSIHALIESQGGFLIDLECVGTTNWNCEAADLPENEYTATLFAVDKTGLVSEINSSVKIDFTINGSAQHNPQINSHNLNITNDSIIISGTVSDSDGDLSAVMYNFKNSSTQTNCALNSGQYSCTINNLSPGTYYIELQATDANGNNSSIYGPIEATIDPQSHECHTAMTFQHIQSGRAYVCKEGWAAEGCANGSDDNLGTTWATSSLQEQSAGYWVKVSSCP